MKLKRKTVLCVSLSAILAFAVLFANCAPVYAAETTAPEDTCENVVSGDDDEDIDIEYYNERLQMYEKMKNTTIEVNIWQNGAFLVNQDSLYAREVVGVNKDGSFQLGPWHSLNYRTNVVLGENKKMRLDGTFIEFAYSFDIFWGTDWPYAGIFYNSHDEIVKNIDIKLNGFVRNADIYIKVNDKYVVYETDCSSHDYEWIPGR